MSSQQDAAQDDETVGFEGREGLERLSGLGTLSAPDADRFAARLNRVRLGSVVVESFETTPIRLRRTADDAGGTESRVVILAVRKGGFSVTEAPGRIHLSTGDVAAFQTEMQLEVQSTESISAVQATMRSDLVPAHLREVPPMPMRILRRTLLVECYTGFLESVIGHREPLSNDHDHLTAALEDLTLGVLAEARGATEPKLGAAGLRHRIKDYIERNSANSELNPAHIAEALGVSVRNVHHVFRDESESISSAIRERRLNAVAAMLSTSPRETRVADLATRSGFMGPDQLTRAFRQRYGVTIEEYRDNSEVFRL